jgi:ribosomal protein S14
VNIRAERDRCLAALARVAIATSRYEVYQLMSAVLRRITTKGIIYKLCSLLRTMSMRGFLRNFDPARQRVREVADLQYVLMRLNLLRVINRYVR